MESRPVLLVGFLVATAAALRFAGLAAVPEIAADEGLWTNSTKNFARFGDWFMDGRRHLLLSPTFHALSLISFEAFGPSIWAARLVSASLATVSVVLLYALVWRISRRGDLALTTALVFAVNDWLVIQSRYALVEPTQLAFALAAAVLMTCCFPLAGAAAGLAMALALLAKINILFLVPLLATLGPIGGPEGDLRSRLARSTLFAAVALGAAALGYAYLYRSYPEQFLAAFRYELDGVHFEGISSPLARVGRVGIDPVQVGRTVLELLRVSPFLFVLAAMGLAALPLVRPRGALLFATWGLVGSAFFLCQMFQPTRYFYLVSPAYAFLAAVALTSVWTPDVGAPPRFHRLAVPLVAVYLAYSAAYLGMNAVANRGTMLEAVTAWARRNTQPEDVLLAAGYLCTDLENRAYAHYRYARTPKHLEDSIRRLHVRYVIFDRKEWQPQLGHYLAARFPVAARWSFGAVYDVSSLWRDR
ncbi:MAG TPA: phospholipid carrier-dependent glycosyltransferase [Candidatus Tectomicrobia bacterium]|nr:phospholipid carrier-dependent glycosyltransferase [Candidatus Tectomicrobia bacterium]